MKSERRAEAYWVESRKRWQINVQREGQRKTFTSSTEGRKGKHDAEAKADKWLTTFLTEQKFSDAYEMWMADKVDRMQGSTYRMQKSITDKWIKDAFPQGRQLSKITPYDWQGIVNQMGKAGLSVKYVSLVQSQIVNFISYCRNRGWDIRGMNADAFEMPKACKAAKVKKALNAEELNRLLSANPDEVPYVTFFQLCVLTGLRKGEALGLRWDDIYDGSIHINRNIYIDEVHDGKNENALRTVPLQTQAAELLQAHKARLIQLGLLNLYVFVSESTGQRLGYSSVGQYWKTVSESIGVGEITIHELRHTFISVVQGDVPEALLKRAVGHSKAMDTYGVYGHQTDKDIKDTQNLIDTAFKRFK